MNAGATSPEANKARPLTNKYGLRKTDPSFFDGALSNFETCPLLWLVKHMGSPGLNPFERAEILMGPISRHTLDGAANEMVTLSPSWAGSSTVRVANLCVRTVPDGVRIYSMRHKCANMSQSHIFHKYFEMVIAHKKLKLCDTSSNNSRLVVQTNSWPRFLEIYNYIGVSWKGFGYVFHHNVHVVGMGFQNPIDTGHWYLLVSLAYSFYKNGYRVTISSLYFERLNYIKPGARVCQQLH
jgi:hypothetical protein